MDVDVPTAHSLTGSAIDAKAEGATRAGQGARGPSSVQQQQQQLVVVKDLLPAEKQLKLDSPACWREGLRTTAS